MPGTKLLIKGCGLILVCLVLLIPVHSQNLSNKGRDFWITYPAHIDGNTSVMGIYITSDVDASGTVSGPGISIPFTITANTVKTIFIGPGGNASNAAVYLSQQDGIATNAAIHVTATKPVVVYSHIIKQARSGASLILPSTVWGTEYLVPGIKSNGVSAGAIGIPCITVVAREPNTTIEINPKANSLSGIHTAGTPFSTTLANPGDVYQVQFATNSDISGTTVKSIGSSGTGCKPIGVFSSTTWSAFDCGNPNGGDNLYQQLFPVRSFGKQYITAPFFSRNYDIIRVYVTDPATVVKRTENGTTTVLAGLQANSFYEFATKIPNMIESDKPVSVVQFITSQNCNPSGAHGDPEMVVLNPLEQTINDITVFSAHQNFVPTGQSLVNQCYLNIIIKSSAVGSFKVNGNAPKGSFVPIPGTGYSYLQEDVSTVAAVNPVQTLHADSNFVAIAYGYGDRESYGYNAGTNVRDLYQFITIKNQFATINYPATCVNTPFKFTITLPYKATKLTWQFNGIFTDVVINNPVPDSSYTLDGKTLYEFRLPTNYSYNVTGNYPVSVLAINPGSDGCNGEQEIDYELDVFEKPKAKFGWQYSGCVATPVSFKDSSESIGSKVNRWNWSFGDNTTDIKTDPVKIYNTPGNYTVKESIITDIGCLADTTATVSISSVPVAAFTVAPPYCSGSKMIFKDASTISSGTITKWFWDFGNGQKDTLSSNSSPSVIFQAGTYTVKLTVQSGTSCLSLPVTKTITITDGPVADFKLPSVVCLPKGEAMFVNQSTILNIATNPLTYSWQFGDGGVDTATNPVHNFKSAGPFQVTLTVTSKSGCIKDSTKTLSNIFAAPVAGFTGRDSVCLRDTTSLTDASSASNQNIIKYYWDKGTGTKDSTKNLSYVFSIAGNYTIKHWVVSDKGCTSDTLSKKQVINPLPTALFTVTGGSCQGKQTTFTSQATANSGTLTRWLWDMGDGTTKDLNNGNPFGYNYASTGTVQVKLQVTTSTGCTSDIFMTDVEVNQLPVANFGMPEICAKDALATFTDSSTNPNGGPVKYLWKFNDPNSNASNPDTSNLKNGTHKFIAAGNYQVSLIITTPDGCSQSVTKTFTVNSDNPRANFDFVKNNICNSDSLSIINKSNINIGKITKTEIYWNWPSVTDKITDDNPLMGEIYQYKYPLFSAPASKTVMVRFVAYSGGVCQNEVIKSATIQAKPSIVFQQVPGFCPDGAAVQLTQASVIGNPPGTGIYSGQGINSSGVFNPVLVGSGIYTASYKFTSTAGCVDSASQTITVWPAPQAGFTISPPACDKNAITFNDSSKAGFGNITTWKWMFSDATTQLNSNANPFQKTFSPAGNYTAQLFVTTDSGCISNTFSGNFKVSPLPVVDFDLPANACVNTPAVFTDKSTIADNSQSQFSYNWQFGNAGTSSLKNPGFSFPASGNYDIKLQVSSKDGCKSSLAKTLVNVLPQPVANFSMSGQQACTDDTLAFTDLSNPLSQTITAWTWNFGDGNKMNGRNVAYSWLNQGNYDVSHYYVTSIGCNSDTIVKTVSVNPVPGVDAGPDIYILQGGQKPLQATVSGSAGYQYLWTPATGLNNPNILQPVASSPAIEVTYTLTVTGTGGCSASDKMVVKRLENPIIPNAFSPNNDGINDTWMIRYIDSYAESTISIFDRYGRQVFAGKGSNRPWDGTQNGKPVPVGVYYYIIDLKIRKPPISGSVTIIR